ncbi:inositol monophosphatase family protein [Luteipulveratus mongoliensis]|uniref:Phosphatase n=1 Tax=Luteipulveratus mongoliensis TaxID=571913 RepID=A0A0K1JIC5_9MICO|nr:inositol monophosphatase family protein [Luteipulveratus mongoliensis]AKU16456.1 phosphatase [Luteipulveratus mongoliensis]
MNLSDSALARTAAEAGAAIVRSRYGATLTRIAKSPNDFATDADIDAERVILDVVRSHRPLDALVAEESGQSGQSGAGDRTWLIDPLCGTLNFAAETPLAAVNVALRAHGRVDVAAVADPISGEIFWTDEGRAVLRRDGSDEPIAPNAQSLIVDINIDAPFPNGATFRAADLLGDNAFLDIFRPRVISSTLAVAWVAAGRRAAYVTDGDLRDNVHFSAGIALCQAAGCVVTDLHGAPLGAEVNGLVVAADHSTHEALLGLIRSRSRRS